MSESKKFKINRTVVAVAFPILVILAPLAVSVYDFVAADDGDQPFLEMPAARYTECVRDTEYMRYHHWTLLREARDQVVRDGTRGDISLDACRRCHTNRERFCNQCHRAVSLQPDCFGCHYYPDTPEAAATSDHAALAGAINQKMGR